MKFKLILFFSFCFSMTLFSQIDGSKKSIQIKDIDTSLTSKTNLSVKISPILGITSANDKPYLYNKPLTDYFKKTSGVDITAKSTLIQPTWDIKQKFSEDQSNVSKFSRDHYLGDLKTRSKYIRIKCRDHEYVDGDRIKLFLNKAVIHPNLTLTGSFYTIDIEIGEGLNTIEFEALNEGLSRPNTAELKVYDENNILLSSNRWLITTGYKARLIVFKQ